MSSSSNNDEDVLINVNWPLLKVVFTAHSASLILEGKCAMRGKRCSDLIRDEKKTKEQPVKVAARQVVKHS